MTTVRIRAALDGQTWADVAAREASHWATFGDIAGQYTDPATGCVLTDVQVRSRAGHLAPRRGRRPPRPHHHHRP